MKTIKSACERLTVALWGRRKAMPRLNAGRSSGLLAVAIGIGASLGPLACSDDETQVTKNPLSSDSGANPRDAGAGLDASVATSDVLDASAEQDAGVVSLPPDSSATSHPIATDAGHDSTSSIDVGTESAEPALRCVPVACECPDRASLDCCPEAIPYRRAVVAASKVDAGVATGDGDGQTTSELPVYSVTKDEVWRKFDRNCGGVACHGGANNPTDQFLFKLTADSFDERPGLGDECLERVTAPADRVMPPRSGDGTKRECGDQFVRLCEEIKALEAASWPQDDEISVEGCAESGNDSEGPAVGCGVSSRPYAVTAELAQAQTNIGSCVPTSAVPTCDEADLLAKDKQFETYETSEDLPKMLWDTDLVSLDSEVLASHRVFSYAPTYTLFSDNAKKQRYVRVPVGKVIAYNDEIQDFDIPDNTRFYKTFLRQVIDKEGNVGYRKMETRLIVVRRDEEVAPGKYSVRALRATYAWSEDEQKATLLDRDSDPMRNGEPWTDRLCPVIIDERSSRDPLQNPISPLRSDKCEYMTEDEVADATSGQIRHYGIPGLNRCDECHMGSNNHSYVLGFNPWQADRRPAGEGGVYDPVHPDELTQLRRFIEYGLISGIEPGQARLEESQGERTPRNDAEVTAQAYMLGNCAYCHSPHGFPTVENPVLSSLDLYPKRGESGGVFQFPLTKQSPRLRLGADGQGRMAYISATAVDMSDVSLTAGKPYRLLGVTDVLTQVEGGTEGPDWFDEIGLGVFGPMKSLIWRNVYTPFTYADTRVDDWQTVPENAIFIHMPRNVPGFDCRAHKIMANWMLSIPSGFRADGTPFEVLPGDSNFARASIAARNRVIDYSLSVTGQHCPTDDDIVDPSVLTAPTIPGTNIPKKSAPGPDSPGDIEARMNGPRLMNGEDGEHAQRIPDGMPGHAHWVTVDLNEPKGQWYPRRGDWKDYLAGTESERAELVDSQKSWTETQREKMSKVLPHLDTVFVSESQKAFSLESVPLGLWSDKCVAFAEATGAPAVGELDEAASSPVNRWLFDGPFKGNVPSLAPERRVHSMSRGQAVFEAICTNCHGANFDSNSPLAKTVAEVTGGRSRVANFRDGLFGPVEDPGAYAKAAFTFSENNTGASAADWQARYLLWMGLGGTTAEVPRSVVSLISTSPFYGEAVSLSEPAIDANMLEPAVATCRAVASTVIRLTPRAGGGLVVRRNGGGFAVETGHYQLWESLCNFSQQPLVRVTSLMKESGGSTVRSGSGTSNSTVFFSRDRNGKDTYGAAWVGDGRGRITFGIQPDNALPWCVARPGNRLSGEATEQDYITWFAAAGIPDSQIPWCPETLFAEAFGEYLNEFPVTDIQTDGLDDTEARDWWYRQGGINAGLAALYYMQAVTEGQMTPALGFESDQCVNRNSNP